MTNSKIVTLTLETASFLVTGNNDKEMLENAKIAFAKQINEGDFPRITYGINNENALSMDTVHAGMIVETDEGDVGIVTATNKTNVHVTYSNGKSVSGKPQAFLKSDKSFEEARKKRTNSEKEINFWFEGFSGFYKNGTEILEVVMGKTTRGKTRLHIVGTKSYLSVPVERIEKNMKDDKSEF